MKKDHWRDTLKSICGSHVAPEKTEQLLVKKNEMEKKVGEIMKLIKDEEQEGNSRGNSNRESELFDLVKDFQEQYQSLYEHYDHITAELKQKFHYQGRKDGELSTSSNSDSDSNHSYEEKARENRKLRNELQKSDEGIKQELEASNDQVTDLKQRLEDPYRNMHKASSSIDDRKKFSEDLQAKADQLKDENSTLWVENGALKLELEAVIREVSDLKQRLEFANERAADLTQRLGYAQEANMALFAKNINISNAMEQEQRIIQELTEEVQRLSERSNESEAEFSAFKMICREFENKTSARIKGLEVQVTDLQSDLASLQTQKIELEEHFEDKSNEAKKLGDESLGLQLVQTDLRDKILELARISRGKEGEILALSKKLGDNRSEATTQTENATAQLYNLQREDRINKLNEEFKQIGNLYLGSVKNLEVLQEKTEGMREAYLRIICSKDEMINILEWNAEGMKKEIGNGREEVEAFKTELCEMEDDHKDLQERLQSTESDKTVAIIEKECLLLQSKLKFNCDVYSQTIKIMQKTKGEKQEEISWLQNEINTIEVKLREHEIKLKEKVGVLEFDMSDMEEEEKLMNVAELVKKSRELEKRLQEREDEVFSIEEEEIEVMRHLNIRINYHYDQIDYLTALFPKP